jgi:hypothetical protein
MPPFLYRCPATGMNVQGWSADEGHSTVTPVADARGALARAVGGERHGRESTILDWFAEVTPDYSHQRGPPIPRALRRSLQDSHQQRPSKAPLAMVEARRNVRKHSRT